MSELPVFDRPGFLERIDGDMELARELMEIFAADYPNQLVRLKEQLSKRVAREVVEVSHALKSVLGNIGAAQCHQRCALIERAARGGSLDGLEEHIRHLEREVEEFRVTSAKDLGLPVSS